MPRPAPFKNRSKTFLFDSANRTVSTRLCTMARYKLIDWLIDRLIIVRTGRLHSLTTCFAHFQHAKLHQKAHILTSNHQKFCFRAAYDGREDRTLVRPGDCEQATETNGRQIFCWNLFGSMRKPASDCANVFQIDIIVMSKNPRQIVKKIG